MGIRGVRGGVKKERGVIVAHPHGILTNMMVVPPTIVSSRVLVSSRWWVGRGWFYLS